jgi:hypothetical protein
MDAARLTLLGRPRWGRLIECQQQKENDMEQLARAIKYEVWWRCHCHRTMRPLTRKEFAFCVAHFEAAFDASPETMLFGPR